MSLMTSASPASVPFRFFGWTIALVLASVSALAMIARCEQSGLELRELNSHAELGPWTVEIVDVSGELERVGSFGDSRGSGGRAWQAPASSTAKFFRRDPSDRPAASGARHRYYLEDPYRPLEVGPRGETQQVLVPSDPHAVSAVTYYVDGDLVIDSLHVRAFIIGGYEQIEIVVRGDITIADDLVPLPGTHLTLRALGTPAEAEASSADSQHEDRGGNIYLQDAAFGTLEIVQADLLAEGRVIRASHAAQTRIVGSMGEGIQGL